MRFSRKWLIYVVLALIAIWGVWARQAHSETSSKVIVLYWTPALTNGTTIIESKTEDSVVPNECYSSGRYFTEGYELTASQTVILSKIIKAACDSGVDEKKAMAIAYAESRFRNVCNTGGCRYGIGVFQIIQSTFNNFKCVGTPHDIDNNITCGIKIMRTSTLDHWGTATTTWGSFRAWWPVYLKIKQYERTSYNHVRHRNKLSSGHNLGTQI